MKKIIQLFLLLGLCMNHVHAQDMAVLKDRFYEAREDTTRARLLIEISALAYNNYNYDTCTKYSSIALTISDNLLNQPSAPNNPATYLHYKKLKAGALEYYGCGLTYNDAKTAKNSLLAASILWNETKDKAGMASVYLHLAELMMNQNKLAEALVYFKTSISLYSALKDKQKTALAYYEMALTQRYMSNFGDALENNLVALDIAKEIQDSTSMLQCLLANGFIYLQVKDYKEALKTQENALQVAQGMHDSAFIATAYSDLGVTYGRMDNPEEALKNHYQALAIRKNLGDPMDLSSTYSYISEILSSQGRYKEALINGRESLALAKKISDKRKLNDGYYYIGYSYMSLGDYQQALLYYDSSMTISKQINDLYHQSFSLQAIANVYIKMNMPDKAISILQQALLITVPTDYGNLTNIYMMMKEGYASMGDYEKAYASSLKYNQYDDSLANNEKALKIASLTNQLEFENKRALLKASQDKQLALQQSQIEKQKLIKNISIIGLIAFVGIALLFFRRFKEKQKLNKELENTLHELKTTQAQLVQSEKMASLGELTAGIAHEIQNPLNFVNNFSELNNELIDEMQAEMEKGNLTEAKQIADNIKANAAKVNYHGKRADAIVKGMLQHSRKNTGQKELTDINALCDEYLRLSYHGLRAKDKQFNANYKTSFDEHIGKINIVPQDMGRALLNLVNNAFYACTERNRNSSPASAETATEKFQPLVTVETKKLNNAIQIIVSDNGNGIPPTIIEKIFQPFFTTKPTGQGTGLGLSMTYDIITKVHNGTIRVDSKEGEGTTFTIQLPVS